MLFTQLVFFLFFGVVFAVHWALRSHRARKVWLLLASYAFYAAWDWRFLFLIFVSTGVDYVCGREMGSATAGGADASSARARRRPWVITSVAANLFLLGFFKYFGFFVDSAVELARALGFDASPVALGIVLPVGISFYTFQTMSYTLDVYRGRLEPVRSPLDFALFVAFFPQLVAGPIVRASTFLPQLAEPRRFGAHVDVRGALALFLVGFFKKACVADGIAVVVDPVFADTASYSMLASWTAVVLYHVQIYCDFSGYSDMAIATAGLLGYRLPLNFDFPYLARSIGEFWRKWHISLATWLRDYLYLPLLGRAPTQARRTGMLFVTLTLCGLWHGAGWNFAAFGALHGVYLVLDDLWTRSALRRAPLGRAVGALSWPLVSLAVLMTWPVFRIEHLSDTATMFATMFGLRTGGASQVPALAWVVVALALALHVGARRGSIEALARRTDRAAFAFAYGLAWSLVLPWVAEDAVPFIYFQF